MKKFLLFLFLILSLSVLSGSGVTSSAELPPPGFLVEQTRSDPERSARAHGADFDGPIIDVHAHLYPPERKNATRADINKKELKKIIKILKGSNIEFIIFMPTPNDGIRRNQELGVVKREMIRDMDKGRIGNFCGSNYITNWLDSAYPNKYKLEEVQGILKRLSKDIDSGKYNGVGEVGIYHFDKGYGKRQHVIEFPPNFDPLLRIVDLIAKKGTWLDLHTEPVDPKGKSYENETFGGIELFFQRNPDLKLIYSCQDLGKILINSALNQPPFWPI